MERTSSHWVPVRLQWQSRKGLLTSLFCFLHDHKMLPKTKYEQHNECANACVLCTWPLAVGTSYCKVIISAETERAREPETTKINKFTIHTGLVNWSAQRTRIWCSSLSHIICVKTFHLHQALNYVKIQLNHTIVFLSIFLFTGARPNAVRMIM